MQNLLYLSEQDFYVDQGTKGLVVCTKQPGICFVFFHGEQGQCKYCDTAKPEFMQLPYLIGGAKFGMVNLSRCNNLQQQSLNTITPLRQIPTFILFVNGRPFINYDSTQERTVKKFAEFMQNIMQRLQKQQSFNPTLNGGSASSIPSEVAEKTPHGLAYDYDYITIGDSAINGNITCTDDGVCYFTNAEIAPKSTPKPPSQPQAPQAGQGYRPQAQGGITQINMPQQQQFQPQMSQGYPQQQMQQMSQGYPQQVPQQMYNPNQHAMMQSMRQPTPQYTQPNHPHYAPQMGYPQQPYQPQMQQPYQPQPQYQHQQQYPSYGQQR